MKKIFLSYMMIGLLGLLTWSPAFAAIECRPGMNNCPDPSDSGDPLNPQPVPQNPDSVQASGYFEVPSPECLETDKQAAQRAALAKAREDAEATLGSKHVKQASAPRYVILKCAQSIYAGSFQGSSWIVDVSVDYSL